MRIASLVLLLAVSAPALGKSGAADYLGRPDAWYRGEEARRIADNVLSYQSSPGGWPKNTNTTTSPYRGPADRLQPTFDNGATTDEMRFLARVHLATNEAKYRDAFIRGLDYILKAQYPTGGWPQFHPPGRQYHRHITFNDDAMVRLMRFLREVSADDRYAFVDAHRRAAAKQAFDRGIECILKCQIRVNGKPTGWCAQHDETDYSPRAGRTYELVSISGAESVGIVRFLISIDKPSPEVVSAIENAMAWFESAKLSGVRVVQKPAPGTPRGYDKVVVNDPAAPPLWARFYEIGANRPIFCDRDGVPKHSLAEIGYERRNGYAWLGDWPAQLLAKEYPAWKARLRRD